MSATEEQQKAEKEKSVPKDAQVMISILKDMGINEFEPRVVNQMLEFSYRWVSFEGTSQSQLSSPSPQCPIRNPGDLGGH